MDNGIRQCFTHRFQGNIPNILPTQFAELRRTRRMLLDELEGIVQGNGKMGSDVPLIYDPGLIRPAETLALNPYVRAITLSQGSKEKDAPDRRHELSLMPGGQAQGLRGGLIPLPQPGKQPGSIPEVQRFRVNVRHRFLVIEKVQRRSPQFRRQ